MSHCYPHLTDEETESQRVSTLPGITHVSARAWTFHPKARIQSSAGTCLLVGMDWTLNHFGLSFLICQMGIRMGSPRAVVRIQ